MENEEYTTNTTKYESELITNFPSEYNKKFGESLLLSTERLLKYTYNPNHNHNRPYEEKENEKVSPYIANFKSSPEKIAATITAPPPPTLSSISQQQIHSPTSRESINYVELYSKFMNGHSDMGTVITDPEVARNSIKRKANDQENHFDNNESVNYLMKYKKQFSNKISSSYASSIPPDLDLPLDIFNEPSTAVNMATPAPISNILPIVALPPVPITSSRTNINPYAIKDCSEEIKKILKEKIKLNKNGGKLMKGLINELGGQITNEYAQYLGLQPAVKFKCFKCGESQFPSLVELKDHQMICLSKSGGSATTKSSNGGSSATNKLNNNSNCKNNSESNSKINKIINNNGNSSNHHNDPSTKIRITRKVFLCSACGTYYENWNLFLHMREVHKRHTCLYCLGLFATSERLLNHLENKHNIKEKVYDSKEHLITSFNNPCYLMCSNCEHVFSEMDNFHSHLCENYLETCIACGVKYAHKHNCNISNSNKVMAVKSTSKLNKDKDKRKLGNNQSSEKDISSVSHNNSTPLVNGNDHVQHEPIQPTFLPPIPPGQNHYIPETRAEPENTEQQLNFSVTSDLNKTNPSSTDVNSSLEDRISSDSGSSSSAEEETESSDEGDDVDLPPSSELNQFATIISNIDENLDSSHQQKIVPKLKIKFNSKAFSTPILSGVESSTDGSDEEEEDEEEMEEHSHENAKQNQISSENNVSIDQITPMVDDRMDIEEPEPIAPNAKEFKSKADNILPEDQKLELGEQIKMEKTEIEEKHEISSNEASQIHNANDIEPEMEVEKKSEYESEPEQPSMDLDEDINQSMPHESAVSFEIPVIKPEPPSDEYNDGIVEASEDSQLFELRLNSPLDRIDIKEFIGICLQSSIPFCLYCNHARRILVNGKALALHLIGTHRFSATVNSITAEELLPSTIITKLKSQLDMLDAIYFSLDSLEDCHTIKRDIFAPAKHQFECFQCRFITNIHKELYLHNRKMHLKSILLCIMCKSNFYSYSELICHICPGTYNKVMILDLVFKCCLCELENIPSAFRLMVHLRKKHNACDVCLEECYDQSRLSNHVWKHKLHHLCYRCGIAYRNKPDITKHLFWKHGTESVVCKKCLQKKWPHVYHFCIPPPMFTCESCSLIFHKAVSLKVHKRLHNGDAKYPCTEDNCEKKFISRKLLLKHVARHSNVVEEIPMLDEEEIQYNEEGSETEHPEENDDSIKSGDESIDEGEKSKKEKRKKNKVKEKKETFGESIDKTNKPVIRDIMDLPALNLSESDSSDEEENANKSEFQFVGAAIPQDMNDRNEFDELDANNVAPIMNIWDNFRSFQASQKKPVQDDDREPNIPPPILHVVQSDHDYSMMYRPIKEIQEDNEDDKKMNDGIEGVKDKEKRSPSKKTQKSSDSSSSDSSSGSDSCSCGTDCSCSSSSSGSSSSSSSSDDENNSSSSENRKKLSAAAKEEKIKKMEKKRQKVENESAAAAAAAQLNESLQQIDVVATDTKFNITIDPDSIILESDLETDESETDEDFYDEHPQKLANQILAEKRRQLMLQTCLNPMNNAIVENSRPSTPSLPEDVVKEKRIKIKKKKKKRNAANSPEPSSRATTLVPPLKISIQNESSISSPVLNKSMSPPILSVGNAPTVLDSSSISTPPVGVMPALISSNSRLSTGSGSETDATLKRSKRRRIPNRFYGYSSDEEAAMSVMKPTPPPNLTWRKEDLPSPTNVKTPPVKTLKIRSPSLSKTPVTNNKTKSSRNSSPVNLYPPIPPVIIRPSLQTISSQLSLIPPPIPPPTILAQPPRVEPLRVPAVPVHHILPPEFPNSSFSEYSDNSDSDSSNEGGLQILQKPTAPLKTKIILTKTPSAPRIKKDSAKRQPKTPRTPKTPKTPKNIKNFTALPPASAMPTTIHQTIMPAQTYPVEQILPPPPILQSQLIQQPVIQPPIHHPPPRLPGLKYPLFLPPRGTRTEPKEGESVYCYCQCPYDEVSEMIACDGEDCQIEWFHFECVGIMVPPKGKWYCPDCKPKYLSGNNEYLEEDNT